MKIQEYINDNNKEKQRGKVKWQIRVQNKHGKKKHPGKLPLLKLSKKFNKEIEKPDRGPEI